MLAVDQCFQQQQVSHQDGILAACEFLRAHTVHPVLAVEQCFTLLVADLLLLEALLYVGIPATSVKDAQQAVCHVMPQAGSGKLGVLCIISTWCLRVCEPLVLALSRWSAAADMPQVRIELYDRKQTKFISAHNTPLVCLTLSMDGKRLATASDKGTLVRVWNTADGALLQVRGTGHVL